MRRVVVTGMGMVTPLACGVEATWARLIAGDSGARKIDTFDVSDITCKIAGMIPYGDGSNGTYNPDQWMEPKEQRKVDKFIVYAMCAAKQALENAGWKPSTPDEQYTTGVMIGAGIGGVEGIADTAITCTSAGRGGCRRSSYRAASSISPPAMSRSSMALKARTPPSSPPARPARMRSATLAG